MLEILQNLFYSAQFMPHGHCYLWKPELVWLHVVSDSLTALAYYSIPLMLAYFIRQRRELPFHWLFWLFALFIASCGTTHLMEVWTLWHPAYWLSGAIKAVTAIVSCYTALAMLPLIPQALTLPSPEELKAANEKLGEEIKQRQQKEEALQKSETRYRAIVEDQTEFICRFGSGGVLSFVNEAYCRYFEKNRVELIGRSFFKFLPPQEVLEIERRLAILNLERPTGTWEHKVKMPNGELRWHRWTNRAIFDSENNLVEYQAVGRDITDLRESEKRFQAIFNQTFQFMGLLEPDGTILEANQTFLDLAGIEYQEIAGRALWQGPWWFRGGTAAAAAKSDPVRERLTEAIAKASRGEFARDEFEMVGADGKVITIDLSLKPVSGEEDLGVGLLILEGRDITERKEAERLVRSLNAELEQRVRDRTEGLKRANKALKNRIRQQQVVAQLGLKALSLRDISLLMDETAALVAQTLDVKYCKILELLPGGDALLLRAGVGWDEGLVGRAVVDTGMNSQAGYTLRSSKPVIVEDLRAETRFSGPQLLRDHNVVSGMSATIAGKEGPFGVLGVHTTEKCAIDKDDAYFILSVTNVLAAAIERETTEAELRSREEMFAELTENIREVFWMTSLDKRELIYASPAYEAIWGRSLKSAYRQPESFLLEGVHPEDIDRVRAGIEKQKQGAFASQEYRILRPDGSIRWLVTRAFPVRDRTGKIYRTAGISEDITGRKEMEMELFQEKELAEVTLKSIGDAVITTDEKGRVNYLNPIAEKLAGWKSAEAKGKDIKEIFNPVHEIAREPLENPVTRVFQEKQIANLADNAILIARNGEEYAVEDSAAPIRSKDGEILGAVVVFRDVTQTRKMARQLSWQAKHDPLTGLPNRLEFEKSLEEIIAKAREEDLEYALCFLDLDRFKIVNDTCGHGAGDELLRQITALLTSGCRQSDILARLGGDEFGLLLLQCNLENAIKVADKLIESVRNFRFIWEEQTFSIGLSMGLVEVNKETIETLGFMSGDRLLSAADGACYGAKNQGRNRFHVYRPEDNAEENGAGWLKRIELATKENRFELYYQPLVPLAESDSPYYQIHLRLKDKNGESIPTAAFQPAAKRYNLMPQLDRLAFTSLLSYLSPDARPEGKINLDIECGIFALPLSVASLGEKDFLDFVKEQFDRYCVSPQRICFELEEREAIANRSKVISSIAGLAEMGCNFALDEFGGSMSAFTYLKSWGVDFIKIDGSMFEDFIEDPLPRAMVEAINRIGHLMGLKTIAAVSVGDGVGIEKARTLGIDYAQDSDIVGASPF